MDRRKDRAPLAVRLFEHPLPDFSRLWTLAAQIGVPDASLADPCEMAIVPVEQFFAAAFEVSDQIVGLQRWNDIKNVMKSGVILTLV